MFENHIDNMQHSSSFFNQSSSMSPYGGFILAMGWREHEDSNRSDDVSKFDRSAAALDAA